MAARIDSHQHFWIYNEADYPWIDSARGPLKVDYMPPDMQSAAGPRAALTAP